MKINLDKYRHLYGYNLIHAGTLALARAEQQGFCVDIEYCEKAIAELKELLHVETEKMYNSELGKLWQKEYGRRHTKYSSDDQLRYILFNKLGIEPTAYTTHNQEAVDEENLNKVDVEGIDNLIQIRKYTKTKDTYLTGFLREQVDGVLHPFFNLHNIKTYRSGSSNPNFQNIPNRSDEMRRWIRRAIRPRNGHKLGAIDYSGAEVKISCAYHKDPNLIKYSCDDSTDMHRDTIKQLFKINDNDWDILAQNKIAKPIRQEGKGFVFAEFYGDFYKPLAKKLWEHSHILKYVDDKTVRDHLRQEGLTNYNTFESHVEAVEKHFWNVRFKKYNKWRNDFWNAYCEKGWFRTLTGFILQGEMTRNEVTNAPIQGSAFHCLLLAFVILDDIALTENWQTKLIGQIHDEILLDLHPLEEEHVMSTVKWVMTEAVPNIYNFVNVPLEVEADLTPLGGTWYDKEEYVFIN